MSDKLQFVVEIRYAQLESKFELSDKLKFVGRYQTIHDEPTRIFYYQNRIVR
jgi:hypothetical protein